MFKLVIQAQDIATQDLKQLAKLCGATKIEAVCQGQLLHQAFKLTPANPSLRDEITSLCQQAHYDYAWLPIDAQLADIGLVVMDMDSTLITIECIDEIADIHGIKEQVAAITARAMRGELDFRQSLSERVALLAGLQETALQRVYDERLQLMPGAQIMLQAVQAAGIKTLLISGGFTYFTERLKTRLGLSHCIANQLEVEHGQLSGRVLGDIVDAQRKRDELVKMRNALGLRSDQVVAVGDGANDLPMLKEAGFGLACHAKPTVQAQASWSINHVGLDGLLGMFA